MGFLVRDRVSSNQKNKRHVERVDIELIAIGKRTGLSFAEINEFRVKDLLDFVDAYTGSDDKPREATQEDIDAFYAS